MSREQDIIGGALEFDDAKEQRGYVLGACGDDEELLGRVERLLEAFSGAEREKFLPGPLAGSEAPIREGEGSVIGRYKLLQKIGEGGFGVVYMADQMEPVKRRVALKIIKLGMDTKQVVGRFEAERQALALMDHPNIAKVLDAGATESGRPYFVMELVRGVPLMQFCDEQKLSTTARIKVFLDICGAIEHAHQKGIIHRDLKPNNVIVTLHNDKPMPKVIDFGIAKATQQDLTDKTLFTRYEDFVGTPAYMSPEQAHYSGLDIDTRSDIYSLGVMLYELLIGRPPFDSNELLNSGIDELRRRIREEEPKRPSTHVSSMENAMLTRVASARRVEPASFSKLLRGELDWIVMRAMDKERERRYASADALAADLRRYLDGDVVDACPPSALYRFKKFSRKNRLAFGVVAAVMAALGVGLIMSAWQAARASRAEQQATYQLWKSYLHQARLNRGTRKPGQRYETLEIVRVAAAIQPSTELRSEAIAAMVLPDFRLLEPFHPAEPELVGARCRMDAYQALAAGDGAVREYTQDGRLVREMNHNGDVDFVGYSPDKRFLAAAFTDRDTGQRTTALWRRDDQESPFLLLPHQNCIGYSRDGKLLAVGRRDKRVAIFDLQTAEMIATYATPFSPFRTSISPDNQRIAISNRGSKQVYVIALATGETLLELDHSIVPGARNLYESDWDSSGSLLVTSTADFVVHLWDANSGDYLRGFRGHGAEVLRAAFHPSEPFLFTASWDSTTRVWDYRNGRFLIEAPSYEVMWPDGEHFEVGQRSSHAGTWGFDAGARWLTHYHLEGETDDKKVALSFSPDSCWLAGAAQQGTAVWDLKARQRIAFGGKMPGYIVGVAFEPGGTELLASDSHSLQRWALRTEVDAAGDKRFEFQPRETLYSGALRRFSLSRDGKTIAGIEGRKVVLLDLASGEVKFELQGQPGIRQPGFGPSGRWLAAGCWQGRGVRVWDLDDPDSEPQDFLQTETVTHAQISADGNWLAASGRIGGLKIWKTGSWEPGADIISPGGPLRLLAIDPTGRYLFATAGGGELQVIDFASREKLAELRPPIEAKLEDGLVSPDGNYVAMRTEQRDVFVWDIAAMRADLAALGLDWD